MKSKRDTDKVNFTWSDVLDSIEAFNKILYNLLSYIFFKGDPHYTKITFIRCLNTVM